MQLAKWVQLLRAVSWALRDSVWWLCLLPWNQPRSLLLSSQVHSASSLVASLWAPGTVPGRRRCSVTLCWINRRQREYGVSGLPLRLQVPLAFLAPEGVAEQAGYLPGKSSC